MVLLVIILFEYLTTVKFINPLFSRPKINLLISQISFTSETCIYQEIKELCWTTKATVLTIKIVLFPPSLYGLKLFLFFNVFQK